MHPTLLMVPNVLFYNQQIKNGYKHMVRKKFMLSEYPFLFINVPDGVEKSHGTSFVNEKEVKVVADFCKYMMNEMFAKKASGPQDQLKESKEEDLQFYQDFNMEQCFVITPYNA